MGQLVPGDSPTTIILADVPLSFSYEDSDTFTLSNGDGEEGDKPIQILGELASDVRPLVQLGDFR